MSTGGKGSKPRPISVPREKFDSNWDAIFKKPKKKKVKKDEKDISANIDTAG